MSADTVVVNGHIPRIGFELADTEGDLLIFSLDTEDNGFDFLSDFEDFAWFRNTLCPRQFSDVNEAFDTFFEFDEGTVRNEVDNLALDVGTDWVLAFDVLPRIGSGLLEAEGDTFAVAVDFCDHDVEFFADSENFTWMGDAAPGHIGDMEETVKAIEIDKGTVVGDVLNSTANDVTWLDIIDELTTFLMTLLFDEFAARDDDVVALEVDFKNLKVVSLTNVLVEILRRLDIDLRSREEGVDADTDDETTFDFAFNAAWYDGTFGAFFKDVFPVFLLFSLIVGEDWIAVFVFDFFKEDFDFASDSEVAWIDEFRGWYRAFGFAADVDDYFVLANFGDDRFNDGADFQVFETARCEQGFHFRMHFL